MIANALDFQQDFDGRRFRWVLDTVTKLTHFNKLEDVLPPVVEGIFRYGVAKGQTSPLTNLVQRVVGKPTVQLNAALWVSMKNRLQGITPREGAAVAVALLNASKQPALAAKLTRVLVSEIGYTEAPTKAPKVDQFAALVESYQGLAKSLTSDKREAVAFANQLAADVNWHNFSLGGGAGDMSQLVDKVSRQVDYSIEDAAALIYALFTHLGMGAAARYTKQTLRQGLVERVASQFLNSRP